MNKNVRMFSALLTAILSSACFQNCYAQSSVTSGSNNIPSATTDVKPGDWMYWRANRGILSEVPAISTSTSSVSTSPPSAADQAAAANALQEAAEAAIKTSALTSGATTAASTPTSNTGTATATNTSESGPGLQAAIDAAKQAAADAKKAGAANSRPPISNGTVAAAQTLIESATSAVGDALKAEQAADQQQLADATALATAKAPTQAQKDKLASSTKFAADMHAKTATALAYQAAAVSAYKNIVASLAAAKVATYCAPSGSRFLVTNIISGSTPTTVSTGGSAPGAGSTKSAAATDTNAPAKTVQGIYPSWSSPLHLYFRSIREYAPTQTPPNPPISPCSDTSIPIAHYDTLYQFPYNGEIAANDYEREGWTWGPMVIPYKFYLKNRTFKGNPSTVAFVGYEGWFPGLSVAYVTALGPGIAQSPTSTTPAAGSSMTPASTSTVVTYTAATGFVATFGSAIKAGLLIGKDWQGKGSNFQYEGRTWLALSIGTGF